MLAVPVKNIDLFSKVSWEALTYFNFYRFLIAFLFVSLYWIGQLPEPLGQYDRHLFGVTAHIYLLVSVGAQLVVRIKFPAYFIQVTANIFADIILVTVMMYASAGLSSGFGMLLVIAVAGGSLLSSGRIGILYASVATILVLGHEVYMQLQQYGVTPNYTHAGFLGITFFVTSIISRRLAGKVEESEALAEQRGQDLKNLAQLNDNIVQRLQSGVIVLDEKLNIKLLNESAKRLMNVSKQKYEEKVTEFIPGLAAHLENWMKNSYSQPVTINMGKENVEVLMSISRLGAGDNFNILIFLEEMSPLRQRAQQMKLASLGRLTASIAHEIRNPLGAISHAGQLLSESEILGEEDKRLTKIIDEHSKRVNNIIENVMRISRREPSIPAEIELVSWLVEFIDEFCSSHDLDNEAIKLNIHAKKIWARMDPGQLNQILWNLCENGMRYSKSEPLLVLDCVVRDDSGRPYIDITDHGSGISADIEENLFEPFFTTSSKGAGLGLYIARELCEANQATLNLHANSKDGCSFRINFSHPEKQHILV
jgi:two-component system, NtrC family, sensor histidine kinase PilS